MASEEHKPTSERPYQPSLFVVIEISNYDRMSPDDRTDFDDELGARLRGILHDEFDQDEAEVRLYDEHGVADWMHATIKKGLVA